MSPGAAEQLWAFSLALYRRPGVAPALLHLQDAHRADVNLMLWCCWRAVSGRGVADTAELAAVAELVAPWREQAIAPLRVLRRGLKEGVPHAPAAETEALRTAIQRAEIEAERIEQTILAARAPPAGSPPGDPAAEAERGLRLYLDLLGVDDGSEPRGALAAIVNNCAVVAESVGKMGRPPHPTG